MDDGWDGQRKQKEMAAGTEERKGNRNRNREKRVLLGDNVALHRHETLLRAFLTNDASFRGWRGGHYGHQALYENKWLRERKES